MDSEKGMWIRRMQGSKKIVNKWRHHLSYIWSVGFRQASLQTTGLQEGTKPHWTRTDLIDEIRRLHKNAALPLLTDCERGSGARSYHRAWRLHHPWLYIAGGHLVQGSHKNLLWSLPFPVIWNSPIRLTKIGPFWAFQELFSDVVNGVLWPFVSWMPFLLQPSVTLYPNSVVVNLHDANTSSLYNSQTLWLVQFYSHW